MQHVNAVVCQKCKDNKLSFLMASSFVWMIGQDSKYLCTLVYEVCSAASADDKEFTATFTDWDSVCGSLDDVFAVIQRNAAR